MNAALAGEQRRKVATRKARKVDFEKRKRAAAAVGLSELEEPSSSGEDSDSSNDDVVPLVRKKWEAPIVVAHSAPKRARTEGESPAAISAAWFIPFEP